MLYCISSGESRVTEHGLWRNHPETVAGHGRISLPLDLMKIVGLPSPNHGDTAFTAPLFDEFMRRIMPYGVDEDDE